MRARKRVTPLLCTGIAIVFSAGLLWSSVSAGAIRALGQAPDRGLAGAALRLDVASGERARADWTADASADVTNERATRRARVRGHLLRALARDASWTRTELFDPESLRLRDGYQAFLAELSEIHDDRGDVLLETFHSIRSPELRAVLVMAMGDLALDDTIPVVRSCLAATFRSGNPGLHRAACYALGRMQTERAFDSLVGCLRSHQPDWLWSQDLHRAVGRYGALAIPVLLEEAGRLAAEGAPLPAHLALGAVRGERLAPWLVPLLGESNPAAVRAMAASALGRDPAPESIALVREILGGAGTDETVDALFAGLVDNPAPAARTLLRELLGEELDARRIAVGAAGLRESDDPRDLDVLLELARGVRCWRGPAALRSAALDAVMDSLAHQSSERADRQLLEWMRSPDPDERACVVRAVGFVSGELSDSWRAPLRELALEGDPETVESALLALARVDGAQDEALSVALTVFAGSDDEALRRKVAIALGGLKVEGRIGEAVEHVSSSGDLMTRVIGYVSLAEAGGSISHLPCERATFEDVLTSIESVQVSKLLVSNPDTRVIHAQAVQRFLGRVGGVEDIERIDALARRFATFGQSNGLTRALTRAVRRIQARAVVESGR